MLLAGCGTATGPNIVGIDVTLFLSQEEVAVGEPIEVRVVATNTTGRQLEFSTNSCVLVVRVLDQSNTPVLDAPATCSDIGLKHTLGPGESLERLVILDRRAGESFPLESGTYTMFAGISQDLLNPSDAAELRVRP